MLEADVLPSLNTLDALDPALGEVVLVFHLWERALQLADLLFDEVLELDRFFDAAEAALDDVLLGMVNEIRYKNYPLGGNGSFP